MTCALHVLWSISLLATLPDKDSRCACGRCQQRGERRRGGGLQAAGSPRCAAQRVRKGFSNTALSVCSCLRHRVTDHCQGQRGASDELHETTAGADGGVCSDMCRRQASGCGVARTAARRCGQQDADEAENAGERFPVLRIVLAATQYRSQRSASMPCCSDRRCHERGLRRS